MSRSIFHCRAALTAFVAFAAAALVAACAGNPAALNDLRYDLGPPPAASVSGTLPPLKVLEVSAPPQLDNDGILYRLSTDSQRTARYAKSHWTTSPARLITMRMRTALGEHATVLSGADAVQAPMLKVELEQFEQVFVSSTESAGVLAARATLIKGGRVIAQRAFVARAPASSPDAAGGVRALAAASDDFVGQLGAWLSAQELAGAP